MTKRCLSRLSKVAIAMRVIRERYPDMDATEVADRALNLVPSELRDAEVIDPNTFFLHDTKAET